MSAPWCQSLARMKTIKSWMERDGTECVVARFGGATLVRRPDAGYELRGGTELDAAAAREWTAHFLHEAVLPCRSPRFRRCV